MAPAELSAVHDEFLDNILPYSNGNVHPGFMGWVHGGGNAAGMLAEMLAAGLNANLGGRDHAPIEVERQIVQWMRELFGFPETASGLFVTGTSMANLIAVLVARDAALGFDVRRAGVAASKKRLTAYTSMAAHGSLRRAFDFCGLGSDALRLVPVDLAAPDQSGGARPHDRVRPARRATRRFWWPVRRAQWIPGPSTIWTAWRQSRARSGCGCTSTEHTERSGSWRRRLRRAWPASKPPIRSPSIFTSGGKCPMTPGSCWCATASCTAKHSHRRPHTWSVRRAGWPAGSPWPCDFGPDLSRGFRALKTWFTLKVYGLQALGQTIARTCELARYLEQRVADCEELELLAPVPLNIVCFRYRCPDADRVNARIVVELQESGVAAPSTTRINGDLAIRAAITNHRTSRADIDALVDATLAIGRALTAGVEDLELEAVLP